MNYKYYIKKSNKFCYSFLCLLIDLDLMKYFILIFITFLYLIGNYYIFYRAWTVIPMNTTLQVLFFIFTIIVVLAFFLTYLIGEHLPVSVTSFFYEIGTSWLFISIYFLLFNILADLVKMTHLLPQEFVDRYTKDNWVSFGVVVGAVALIMFGGYLKYKTKERVELSFTAGKEKTDNSQTIKIVALSDLHIGYGIRKNELRGWVQLINKENPDIVLITGDIIDSSVRPLIADKISEEFKHIKSKYGVYAVLGNHEYLSGVDKSIRFYEDAGIKLLRDSTALVDNTFYLVGRDDKTNSGRKSLQSLTEGLDREKPLILLDHQPYDLEEAEDNGIDFQFSGHTHRGQIWPISLITDWIYEDSFGYLKKGNTNIYVSSGMGIWGGKFRIGTQSEYVVINMKIK